MRLLLVHGWATSSKIWRYQEPLSRDFDLRAINLPGHHSNERWESPDFGPGIRQIERELSDAEPTLGIGWSLGGELLLAAAGKRGSNLKGIVSVGSSPSFLKREDFPFGQSLIKARNMRRKVERDFEGGMEFFYPMNFSSAEKKDPAYHDWMVVLRQSREGLIREDVLRCLKGIFEEDIRERLALIHTPVLLIHGALDEVCPVEVSGYLLKTLRHAQLKIFPETGHAPFLTQAEEFNQTVHDFAEEIAV